MRQIRFFVFQLFRTAILIEQNSLHKQISVIIFFQGASFKMRPAPVTPVGLRGEEHKNVLCDLSGIHKIIWLRQCFGPLKDICILSGRGRKERKPFPLSSTVPGSRELDFARQWKPPL